MVAGAKRASCWLACLAPLLCASKWIGEGCARVEDALVRPPKVILHPKSASPPKRWPSWPCLGWAVPHNRAFPRPILRRGLFHRPILRRGLCYARSREEGFVTPDPQNRALLRPIPTARDPDPDAPIPRRQHEQHEQHERQRQQWQRGQWAEAAAAQPAAEHTYLPTPSRTRAWARTHLRHVNGAPSSSHHQRRRGVEAPSVSTGSRCVGVGPTG